MQVPSRWGPSSEKGERTGRRPLPRILSTADTSVQREDEFPPAESEVHQPHPRAEPVPRSSWPTHSELWYSCGLPVSFCFFVLRESKTA